MQLEDWESAIQFVSVQLKENFDRYRIGLWGSSFSGGHVIVTAANSRFKDRIKAVVSQVPYLKSTDKLIASLYSVDAFVNVGKLTFYSLVDKLRALMGISRYYIPICGTTNDLAVLYTPSSMQYLDLVPKKPRAGWENKCPASIVIDLVFYSPSAYASEVSVPTLVVYATQDDLCPADAARALIDTMPHVTFKELNAGHFAPYEEKFEETVRSELEFFQKHLPINK